MTKEQSLFIRILADHLNHTATDSVEDIDWHVIVDWAVKHQVVGVVYHQVKPWAPEKIEVSLKVMMLQAAATSTRQKSVCRKIQSGLAAEQIPYFIVKGLTVAEYYPYPLYRMMGDVDLVLKEKDLAAADQVLSRMGFTNNVHAENGEWNYEKADMHLEIHCRLIQHENDPSKACYDFFDGIWDYVTGNALDANVHFIYVLLHLRTHFISAGVGFRQFMDLAVMMQNCPLDWAWIQEKLDAFGIADFAQNCFGLIRRWFCVESPLRASIEEELFAEATDAVFSNGVFGFTNPENKKGSAIARTRRVQHPWWDMLCQVVFTVFPPYRIMIASTKFSYLKARPYLLPYAWISRILTYKHHHGLKSGTAIVAQRFASGEDIEKRKAWLKKWGI